MAIHGLTIKGFYSIYAQNTNLLSGNSKQRRLKRRAYKRTEKIRKAIALLEGKPVKGPFYDSNAVNNIWKTHLIT